MRANPLRDSRLVRGHRLPPAFLITSVLAIACGSVDTEAKAGNDITRIGIEQDLRIDGYQADLVPIQWLGVSSTGQIALLQWQDYTVRFFDSSGAFLASVGREGAGPGEFRRLVRAGWIGDTLWVGDTQLRRATLISPDFEVVRTVRDHAQALPMPDDAERFTAYTTPTPFALFGDGTSLIWAIQPTDRSSPLDPEAGSPVFHLSQDGFILGQVALIPGYGGISVTIDVGGGQIGGRIPFVPGPAWTVSPSGSRLGILTTAMALPEPSYRVFAADSAGQVIIDRSFHFVPEPIPKDALDSAIVANASRADSTVRRDLESKLRDAAPTVYAEAEEIIFGSDDRVWIGMRTRAEGTRWRVLSPTGDPQGEILLPPRVRLRAAGADHVWCSERDEFDVESVVRYRLDSSTGD